MKKTLIYIIFGSIAFASVNSCKTTEANYRAAYEKTVEGRSKESPVESTIYDRYRREARPQNGIIKNADGSSDTIAMTSEIIGFTADAKIGAPEWMRKYNVVTGEFKQLFNAKSLARRTSEVPGYGRAFVAMTREPLYYVVAFSTDTLEVAAKALSAIENDTVIPRSKSSDNRLPRIIVRR